MRDDAIRALTTLVEDLDPLYRPAEFLLGYTYLRRGDAKNATVVFGRLVERFKDEQRRRIDILGGEWLAKAKWRQWLGDHVQPVSKLVEWTVKNWVSLGRRIPIVDQWVKIYSDLLTHLYGGSFVLDAGTWEQLKLARYGGSSSPNVYDEAYIDRLIELLKGPFGSLAAIAAGTATSQTISPESARRQLDHDLDRHEISMFDLKLVRLEMINISEDAGAATPLIAALLDHRIGRYLRPGLDTLKTHIEARNWSGAKEQVRDLRRYTHDPSPFEFARKLDNADTEKWEMSLVILFMPVFKKVRRLRREFRVPLYIESVLYLAQSFLMSFERDGLDNAHRQAKALREERLAPSLPGRERDVHLLTICLEVEALVRWEEVKPATDEESSDSIARVGIALLPSGWMTQITRAADDKFNTSEVRAAAYVARGMLERRRRRILAERIEAASFPGGRENERSLCHELEQYYLALELRQSPTIHAYVAEALLGRGRIDDARSHIRQALLMAPEHVLAMRLEESISGIQPAPGREPTSAVADAGHDQSPLAGRNDYRPQTT